MLQPEEKSKLTQNAWMRFNSNIGALYSFFEKLTQTADNLDEADVKKLVNEMAFIFEDKPDIVEKDVLKYIPSVDNLDVFPDFRKTADFRDMLSAIQDQKVKDALIEWQTKKPYRAQRFVRLFSSAFNDPPIKGILIRRSMLVSLVTFLEIFIEDLYKNYFLSLDKSKAEAEKEASKLMSGNWREKLLRLEKIQLDTPIVSKYLEEIFEITQRRNTLVHNDGIVDEKYEHYFPGKYKIGDHLLVSTQYFQRAIDLVHKLGFFLFYHQWKHYEKTEQNVYSKLNDFMLDSLRQKRYSLVLELSANFEYFELPDDKNLVVLANRAIAFRDTNKPEDVKQIVAYLENTNHDLFIDIAISMLKNDIPKLQHQIEQIPKSPNSATISTWPLFEPVRNAVWFKMAFMKKSKIQAPKKKRRK
jgi:hypothetical protein